jgi:DNA-binding GntR family transcriptional regulator
MEYRVKSNLGAVADAPIQYLHEVGRASAEKETLAHNVYQRLKEDIFEFRMPPGQRYSEQMLAGSLGVSRTPLRFALHMLAHEGYLNRIDGHSSWQVKPLDLDYHEDLYDFRKCIEVLAIRRLCSMEVAPDLRKLCEFWCVPKSQWVHDGVEVAREDERFHSTLVSLAGNREMLRTFNDLTERIRIIRRLDFISADRIAAAFQEHGNILEALLARDVESAVRLMEAHISSSRTKIRQITLHRVALASTQTELMLPR